jgi:Tfp pilus assembly protein PilF
MVRRAGDSTPFRTQLLDLIGQSMARIGCVVLWVLAAWPVTGQPVVATALVLSVEGSTNAWFSRPGWAAELPLRVNQALEPADHVRTGERTRLTLQLADRTIARIAERSEVQVQRVASGKKSVLFTLWRGLVYFFHRDRPADLLINSRSASAAVRGTDFTVEVDARERMIISLLEGEVELRNAWDVIRLAGGDQGVAEPGRPPYKTAVITGVNEIQWCLYYPGVLDLGELPLTTEEGALLQSSLAAYRSGDLLQALANYPAERQAESPQERVYLAALLLSVGNVEQARQLLGKIPVMLAGNEPASTAARLADSLRHVIVAVKGEPRLAEVRQVSSVQLATEWLAESYFHQAAGRFAEARQAARQAVAVSPDFAFGWVRVAELEFGYAHSAQALRALEKGLALGPRNAQALALKGFVLSAQNEIGLAYLYFDEAIERDGGLGNAWLGRGLCRIHQGDLGAGLADLEIAAAVEPQRALLRSYLGKAFSQAHDPRRAEAELDLAKELDPNDPTAWLYSALLLQQDNRINLAVEDLEKSQAVGDKRFVYRSRLLLDQDLAVRGANLAAIYRDAGLRDVSVRQAVRAVHADYANFSAHQFLANSYNELRDPNQVNIRYETPWFTEYLLANLLAPPGAGTLSPAVSQQEYSRLFDRNRLGFFSQTDYLSSGEWYETGVQHGYDGNTSYAVEAYYHSRDGHRPNNDLEELALTLRFKQQLTPKDSFLFQTTQGKTEAGDVSQYYDNAWADPDLRMEEVQAPILLAGYQREWRPGRHTLLLAGYADDTLKFSNPDQQILSVRRLLMIPPLFSVVEAQEEYRNEVQLWSAELQQIEQLGRHALIVGGRGQWGTFHTRSELANLPLPFVTLPPPQEFDTDFQRLSVYGYDQWKLHPSFCLIAGVSYDDITFPSNFRFPPLSPEEDTRQQWSPKAGLIWSPLRNSTLRAGYSQSLGGASLDQSFRLEPPQIAGFIQSPRSLIPESAEGANAVPTFETIGVSLEQKLGRGTYLGLAGEWLESELERTLGALTFTLPSEQPESRAGVAEELDFQERSLTFTANQLLSEEWSLGLRYRLSQAELDKQFVDIPANARFLSPLQREQELDAILHCLDLFAQFNHPAGIFAQAHALWFAQNNQGYVPDESGDSFWQFNALVGYRFLERRGEIRLGLLNITDRDYQLNPLNLTGELPRSRTFVSGLTLNF